jgi:hypothetical protein
MNEPKPVLSAVDYSERGCDFTFWCPGCEEHHGVWTQKRNGLGAIWSFNGDLVKPTFRPSLLLRYTKLTVSGSELDAAIKNCPPGGQLPHKDMVCHSFITNGQIQFLTDCTHALAGRTVPLAAV